MTVPMKPLLAAILAISATMAEAAPLTVRVGESWVFAVRNGEPHEPRKVQSDASPGKGQIKVTVKALLGTSLMAVNNSPVAYTFKAELIRKGKAMSARTCTLPANAKPVFEQWDGVAEAVRIGRFAAAGTEGRC